MTANDTSVGTVAQRLDGCLPQNSAEDVLDVMDALDLNFMPLVEGFENGRLLGIVARAELTRIMERNGSARVEDAVLIELPQVRADTPLVDLAAAANHQHAWLVTDGDGRVHGVYESPSLA
jgi:predicted transcriptional regulator